MYPCASFEVDPTVIERYLNAPFRPLVQLPDLPQFTRVSVRGTITNVSTCVLSTAFHIWTQEIFMYAHFWGNLAIENVYPSPFTDMKTRWQEGECNDSTLPPRGRDVCFFDILPKCAFCYADYWHFSPSDHKEHFYSKWEPWNICLISRANTPN